MLSIRRIVALLAAGAAIGILSECRVNRAGHREWPEYLGGPDRNHYSPLTRITKENVGKLEVAWTYHTGDFGEMQCNPIVVDGVLYGITAASEVFALNAATGEQRWRFKPSEKKNFLKNRGVAYWRNGKDRRILCTYEEWLYALDAETGIPVAGFGDNGRVSLKTGLGPGAKNKYLMSRTPGAVFEDLIIVPTVMMEDVGAAPGFIQAFDIKTGKPAWIFHTIPLKGQFGFDTWPEDVHTRGIVGGANNWTGTAIDHKRGIVYAPTGSAAPDFFGGSRKGQNLFANTLLALDARTGKRRWHYQIVRHDIWDMDLPSPPNLTTIRKDGREIDVVTQLTKKGHLFVFDRETGAPVFPVEEMKVPASPVPEEAAWPTQPVPVRPLPIARQFITEADLNTHSPDYDSLLRAYRSYNKGIYMPVSDVPTMVTPGLMGGPEWGGAAVDREGVLYINSNEVPWVLTLRPSGEMASGKGHGENLYRNFCGSCHGAERKGNPASGFPALTSLKGRLSKDEILSIISKGRGMMPGFTQVPEKDKAAITEFLLGNKEITDLGTGKEVRAEAGGEPWAFKGYTKFLDSQGRPGIKPPWGRLTAIDLNTGAHKWQVPLGENPEYKKRGIPGTGTENYGGPVVTASGLLFIAATEDRMFRAFDKHSGALLWETELPASGFATPSTYEAGGVQYVVISCGGTKMGAQKGDALVAFRLKK